MTKKKNKRKEKEKKRKEAKGNKFRRDSNLRPSTRRPISLPLGHMEENSGARARAREEGGGELLQASHCFRLPAD